jgi:type IV secretory pathway ATPase VirB11/archaellum biosynthesis ATPase
VIPAEEVYELRFNHPTGLPATPTVRRLRERRGPTARPGQEILRMRPTRIIVGEVPAPGHVRELTATWQ